MAALTPIETYQLYWRQIKQIISKHENSSSSSQYLTKEDVACIFNNALSMLLMLCEESPSNNLLERFSSTQSHHRPLLDYSVLSANYEKLVIFCCHFGGNHSFELKSKLLNLFYPLLKQSSYNGLLSESCVSTPIVKLLISCRDFCQTELELQLIDFLFELSLVFKTDHQVLLEFFNVSCKLNNSDFIVISLLISVMHRDGAIGTTARQAILNCILVSANFNSIARFLVKSSNICSVLATGLNGLYSMLPSTLSGDLNYAPLISSVELREICGLSNFLNTATYCNSVASLAHICVKENLRDFLLVGFLCPVILPAVIQANVDEAVAATTYFNLFIQVIEDDCLMKCIIHFILTTKAEGSTLLNILIKRLASDNKLCIATMGLFHTLLLLHSEDIMLELILKYLLPCSHIMKSQRSLSVLSNEQDFSDSVNAFFALMPQCSIKSRHKPIVIGKKNVDTPVDSDESEVITLAQFETEYFEYLTSARSLVQDSYNAVCDWNNAYDSSTNVHDKLPTKIEVMKPIQNHLDSQISTADAITFFENLNVEHFIEAFRSTPIEKCCLTYDALLNEVTIIDNIEELLADDLMKNIKIIPLEINSLSKIVNNAEIIECNHKDAYKEDDDINFELIECNNNVSDIDEDDVLQSNGLSPTIGPFLTVLLNQIECMLENTLYMNLILTAVIAQLVSYPTPLLRSYLISSSIVFQPSVRSLFQSLAIVQSKIDRRSNNLNNFHNMLVRARYFLSNHSSFSEMSIFDGLSTSSTVSQDSNTTLSSSDNEKPQSVKQRVKSFFKQAISKKPRKEDIPLKLSDETLLKDTQRNKNLVYGVIIFEEFLKELAALAHEHSVAGTCSISSR